MEMVLTLRSFPVLKLTPSFIRMGVFTLGNVKPGSGAKSTVSQDTFGFGTFSERCPVNVGWRM